MQVRGTVHFLPCFCVIRLMLQWAELGMWGSLPWTRVMAPRLALLIRTSLGSEASQPQVDGDTSGAQSACPALGTDGSDLHPVPGVLPADRQLPPQLWPGLISHIRFACCGNGSDLNILCRKTMCWCLCLASQLLDVERCVQTRAVRDACLLRGLV